MAQPSNPSGPSRAPVHDGPRDAAYEIRIARDGTWFYHGSPINRIELVKLFATVLERDKNGDFWLITPAERGRIVVEDAPFVAVGVEFEGGGNDQRIVFRTNLDHELRAGPEHPIRVAFEPLSDEPSPYILVRERVEARISRAVFYDLVEHAVERPSARGTEIGIWSDRIFFVLGTLPTSEDRS